MRDGSTLATMTRAPIRPTVRWVNLRRLPTLSARGPLPALRLVGVGAVAVVLLSVVTTDPRPGPHGDGPWVALSLAAVVAGIWLSAPRRELPVARRFGGLALVMAGTLVLMALQPNSAGYAGIYYVVVIAGMRLALIPAVAVLVVALGGELAVIAVLGDEAAGSVDGLLLSVVPWFMVVRLIRELRLGRDRAEGLVEDLRASQAAQARSAALAERGRVARDLHDVLAHSLSALALQLEGARLLARDRGADPDVVDAIERSHHLAASGLAEARQAIAALHGDELPGPQRLQALAEAFAEQSGAACTVTVTGKPRDHGSEARVALYRTAQEALTNVRRHSAAERVEIRLDQAPDGTTLVVQDFGPAQPAAVPARNGGHGGGYGLTGMRERAELLGGRLSAGSTADGFRVELWLPA
jgi:signal transduction histidine kinase